MKLAVVYNSTNAMAVDASVMVSTYAAAQGFDCVLIASDDVCHEPVSECELVIALGGDGTILRAAHVASKEGTPVLGLNYGHLGFLANSADEGLISSIAAALAGDGVHDERTNLRIDVLC